MARIRPDHEREGILTPWRSTSSYSLYAGDALKILPSLPAASVDIVFADPPYKLSNNGFTCHSGKAVSVNKAAWDKSTGFASDVSFHVAWIAECSRVLKKTGTIWISGTYHSIYQCGFILQKQGWHLINDICWFKSNAPPNLSCRMFTASHETLLWAKKTKTAKHTFNYTQARSGEWGKDRLKQKDKQMRSVWDISPPAKDEKKYGKHPTQKPVRLLERIILTTSNEKDVVLDPFCGSGTTGVAAVTNNRFFIGIDSERKYLTKIARHRIDEALKKTKVA